MLAQLLLVRTQGRIIIAQARKKNRTEQNVRTMIKPRDRPDRPTDLWCALVQEVSEVQSDRTESAFTRCRDSSCLCWYPRMTEQSH